MTDDRSYIEGGRDRHNTAVRDTPRYRQTSTFVAPTSPNLLPRYRVMNTEYSRQQIPNADTLPALSINSTAADSDRQPVNYAHSQNEIHMQSPCTVAEQTNPESREQMYSTSQTTSPQPITNYTTQSNHDIEVNAASTLPVLNSDYIITELPRLGDHSLGHQHIFMMDNSVMSGYNNNVTAECVNQPSLPMNTGDMLACVPAEFNQTRPRRGRRDRQRRRRRRRRSRHHGHRRSGNHQDDETYNKPDCCSVLGCKICFASCLEFKKVLVFFASFGIICVLVGIVLGVLRSPGNNFFALSLSFVAMGMILLTMVLIGWKCIPADHQPCHSIFGLGNYCSRTRRNRRRRERHSWLGS